MLRLRLKSGSGYCCSFVFELKLVNQLRNGSRVCVLGTEVGATELLLHYTETLLVNGRFCCILTCQFTHNLSEKMIYFSVETIRNAFFFWEKETFQKKKEWSLPAPRVQWKTAVGTLTRNSGPLYSKPQFSTFAGKCMTIFFFFNLLYSFRERWCNGAILTHKTLLKKFVFGLMVRVIGHELIRKMDVLRVWIHRCTRARELPPQKNPVYYTRSELSERTFSYLLRKRNQAHYFKGRTPADVLLFQQKGSSTGHNWLMIVTEGKRKQVQKTPGLVSTTK